MDAGRDKDDGLVRKVGRAGRCPIGSRAERAVRVGKHDSVSPETWLLVVQLGIEERVELKLGRRRGGWGRGDGDEFDGVVVERVSKDFAGKEDVWL